MSEFAQRQKQAENSHLVSAAKPDRTVLQPTHAVNPLMAQQGALGNQATQRFAQSCPLTLPSPGLCPTGGVCHTCPAPVQAKLTINKPGDKYEREADRVAEQVMRMPDPQSQEAAPVSGQAHTPRIQRVCTECEEELQRQPLEEEEEQETLQAKEATGRTPEVAPDVQAHVNAMRGGGQPLPESVRAFFEPRFGYEFSRVRVHTDARAAQLAQAVNARAFTIGRDVVFRAGQYAPGTGAGKRLLVHELVHVMQQLRRAGGKKDMIRRQSSHTFQDCGGSQKQQLKAASQSAEKSVERAEAFVGSGYGRPSKMSRRTRQLLVTHFHTTKRDHLRDILFEFIKIEKAFKKGVDFECEQTCKSGTGVAVCGYGQRTQWFGGFGDVHMCFDRRPGHCHFVNSLTAQEQEVLVIHEVAHRYAGIRDKAYRLLERQKYSRLTPSKAMDNADSYAWFAVQL